MSHQVLLNSFVLFCSYNWNIYKYVYVLQPQSYHTVSSYWNNWFLYWDCGLVVCSLVGLVVASFHHLVVPVVTRRLMLLRCECSADRTSFSMKCSNVSSSVSNCLTLRNIFVSTVLIFNCWGHDSTAVQSASLFRCLFLELPHWVSNSILQLHNFICNAFNLILHF